MYLNLTQSLFRQDRAFKLWFVICALTGALSGWLIFDLIQDNHRVVNDARTNAIQRAVDAAGEISQVLETVPILAHGLADEISSGNLLDQDVESRLLDVLKENPNLSAVTACYASDSVPDFVASRGDDRYCPFSYFVGDGRLFIQNIEDSYDYTVPLGSLDILGDPVNNGWYQRPLIEGPVWGEPYLGSATGVYWGGYGTPFHKPNPDGTPSSGPGRTPAGVIDVSLTLGQFQNLVGAVDFGENGTGYGFIVSRTGDFIYHPDSGFVNETLNISDFDPELNIVDIGATSRTEDETPYAVLNHIDPQSGRSSWLVMAPVTPTGWWVGIVLDKESILNRTSVVDEERKQEIEIALSMAAFLFLLALVWIIRSHKGSTMGFWRASWIFSLLAIAGITYMWNLNLTGVREAPENEVLLLEQAISSKVVSDYKNQSEELLEVPTGILIESMNFVSAHNVLFTGYIWQKFGNHIPVSLIPKQTVGAPGFTLPQADIAYSDDVTEVFRRVEEDGQVIGWYFRANLRQQLDSSQYPFNREDLTMRIWPSDPKGRLMLVPDLNSYPSTRPEILPGVDQSELVLGGWTAEDSFFSFRDFDINTTLGMNSALNEQVLPELVFHVGLRRQFADAFISHVIPVVIVAFLLFAVLVIVTLRQESIGIFGFTTSNVLAYCAALFFVVVVSHISLRTGLDAPGDVVYLEFFYFVIYAAILLISLNSIVFTSSRTSIAFVEYRDNLLIEILYWPFITGVLLAISFFVFY